jgi:hypothetical protein
VTGALALDKVDALKARCPDQSCNRKDNGELEAASALGTASTTGLVVGVLGLAAGTAVFFLVQPGSPGPAARTGVRAGLGPGGLHLEGTF